MPEILNIDEFCNDLKEITAKEILYKKKFNNFGLFSEQIFGPCKSYTCQCGKFYGIFSNIKKCDICGVDITNNNERRKRYAKIVLPFPVINPIFYDVIGVSNSTIKKNIDALLYNRKSLLYYNQQTNEYGICNDDQIPDGISETWEKTDAIYELVTMYAKQFIEVGTEKEKIKAQYILENIGSMLINNVIVLPPELRPASKVGKVPTVDQINKIYQNILTKKEVMLGTNIELNNKDIFYNYFTQIQKDVFELYNYILEKLSKKEGMIRGNILGKRVDFSGRAVIAPDPALDIDYCKLPYLIVLELFKLPIAKKLLELNRFKMINQAIEFIDECILYNRTILLKICQEVTKNEVCILNRQPSLHRLSMLGFKILITTDDVIKIHPLVCPPYNADFDGDQMAIYIPISKKATDEINDKLLLSKNFTSPTNGSLTTTPSQDIILGIYALTMDLFPEYKEIISYKGKKISKNLKIFNDCLPETYKVIDYPLKKKELIYILDEINQSYPNDVVAKTLDNIKAIGFIYSTLYGSSMSLDRCYVDITKEVRDEIYKDGDIRTQIERISSKEIENIITDKFQYSYLLKSGARGTWDQARQIILSRGFISNSQGHILPYPIKNSLMEGLTPKEFFYSTYGCRKGLLDVADNTAESGHLSRKLIFACANLLIDLEESDCGVTEDESLKVIVYDKNKVFQLIGKWYYENGNEVLITKNNCLDLIGKSIKVRSPIYCKNDKICSKCYGEMYKKLNSRFAGIIAAQAMGEKNTQLVLRSFHTCLRKDQLVTDVNNNQIKAIDLHEKIQNGEKIYTFSCSSEGDIVVSKFINSFKDRIDNKYIKITLDNDKSYAVTLDHRSQLRDGSYVESQFLKPGDSLMPLYFDDNNTYRRVINNKKGKKGHYKKNLVHSDNPGFISTIQLNHRVKSIEIIYLDDNEYFYDFEVDSEYHNFPLEAGIFVHNSGVAVIKNSEDNTQKKTDVMKQNDVISSLSIASKLFHHFENTNCDEIVDKLFAIYNLSGSINHVHFEAVVAQMMWTNNILKWRLQPNRKDLPIEFHSVNRIPSDESWLMGLGFSNPKKHIINGLFNIGNYSGIMDKLLTGEKL